LLILPETKIMEMYLKNEYKPLSLDETINMGAKALKILYKNNIPCIRFGLPENNEYKGTSIIGPYHPSLKHMIDSKLAYATMYRKIVKKNIKGKMIAFSVPEREMSAFIGIKKENIRKIKEVFNLDCQIFPQH
ncbi:MAG: hypothetical protein D6734_00005, partial [Candidatus Schekmanbacteria bacterium]